MGCCQIVYITVKNTFVFQSCTDALTVEHGLCSEKSVRSCDDSNGVISMKIEGEEIRIKNEEEPIAISSSSVKDEPEVSPQTFHWYLELLSVIMLYCLPFHIKHFSVVNGNDLCIYFQSMLNTGVE